MTTANKITLTRIAMIPFFIWFGSQPVISGTGGGVLGFPKDTIAALVLFCVASFTDFLDGYVARKYNQVTDFGKFVDPLADKLLVSSALVLLSEQNAIQGWMVCVILAREFIITSLRIVAANKGRVMAATWTGKVKTCVQIGGIILIYLYYIFGKGGEKGTFTLLAGWVMTLVTIYSGWDYLYKNRDLIKDS